MIFKKLELQGFKSFSDRTEVNFRNGINAVVGPNGCGKSNIADAIRWVLGEQSPKRLRGENMEDLIFSGSDTRKPLGMAEVSLTVECNGRDFPEPYSKFSELAVTRRLYRSGESEFYINSASCRLRDIRELFMDTGLNPKAYAVIDQGHIGDIINAQPENRRILLEEAAGIARYKERKAAALRKLDATEQNLIRLQDIIREIKRQIRSLKLQATKAEKYNRLRDEVEELELKMLYRQYCDRVAENRSQEAKCGTLEEVRETLRGESSTAEAELETARLSLLEIEKEVGAAQEDYYAHRAQSDSVEHQLQTSRTRLGEIDGTLARNEGEMRRLSGLIEEYGEEKTRLTGELQVLKARLEGQRSARSEAEEQLALLAESAAGLRKKLDEGNSRFLEEMNRENEARNRVTEAETLRTSLGRNLERIQAEIGEREEEERGLREQARRLQAQVDDGRKEREDLRRTQSERAAAVRTTREELEGAEQELQSARDEYARASSRLASLVELERNLSGWPERFRKELDRILSDQRLSGQVKGLLASYVQAPAEYERALEAVLGGKLKYLVVGSRETALEAAGALRSNGEVRGTILPLEPRTLPGGPACEGDGVIGPLSDRLSTPEEYRRLVGHLLRDVVLVRDLSSATTLWSANGVSRTFVTPEGEVLWPDGSITAGPLDPAREMLPLVRRIRETKAAAAAGQEQVDNLAGRRESLKERLGKAVEDEEKINGACYRIDLALSSLEKDLSHAGQKIAAREERRRELAGERDRALAEKTGIEETISREISIQTALEKGRLEQREELNSLEAQLAGLQGREEELTRGADTLRVDLAAGGERMSHLGTRLERLTGDQGQADEQNVRISGEVERLRREREQIFLETEELVRRAGDLSGSREERERRLNSLQENQRLVAGKIGETEENLRRIRLRGEEIQQEDVRLRAKAAELQVRLENLRDRIGEIRNCPPEELWDDETRAAAVEEPHDGIEEEHREKVGRLQSLGPVNLAAIGDHEELRERLDFQVRQQEDLEKASQDLRQAIQKINTTSRRKFLETFEQVNEKFQQVFPILFQKGHAMLKLTDTDDPLDSGIEILAQPAGKKLQRLSLLSGGEKALSAIALLLAIFMVRPTPFCLLDEVDAPLDETNIGRFLELLKTSVNGSQLVVITHNKQTMERAANLVGVTMSDPGVSSLISVRMGEAINS